VAFVLAGTGNLRPKKQPIFCRTAGKSLRQQALPILELIEPTGFTLIVAGEPRSPSGAASGPSS